MFNVSGGHRRQRLQMLLVLFCLFVDAALIFGLP